MDTFDTSEEVMSEIDIEATEVDFGENFEHGVNDKERENNNEQEAGIDGEKGEKNIEDEKLEEKEETLSKFKFFTAPTTIGRNKLAQSFFFFFVYPSFLFIVIFTFLIIDTMLKIFTKIYFGRFNIYFTHHFFTCIK